MLQQQKHVLLIDQYGDYLGVESEMLVIKSDTDEQRYPIDELESVIITKPNGSISLLALNNLIQAGVGISILNRHSDYSAEVSPCSGHALKLGKAQYLWRESGIGALLAKRCILDKIWHQKFVLHEMKRRSRMMTLSPHDKSRITKSHNFLKSYHQQLKSMTLGDIGYEDVIFHHEARAAQSYWNAIKAWLPKNFGFEGRKLRGTEADPINAAFNYGYAILATRITHQLYGHGFNPNIGFLHASRENRASLTYDLIERYRQRYVDVPVMRHAFSNGLWSLDDSGYLDSHTRKQIATCVLEALDPRSSTGMIRIIDDIKTLRKSILEGTVWRPSEVLRSGLSPL